VGTLIDQILAKRLHEARQVIGLGGNEYRAVIDAVFARFETTVGLAETQSDICKWAAIEKTYIFPVSVRFSLTLVRLFVACILSVFVLLVFLWRS
jgi:hypothetical protein